MSARKKPPRGQTNTGQAAVQVGRAGGHVTVIQQTHHHYPPPASSTLLALRVYELHELPCGTSKAGAAPHLPTERLL